MNQVPRTRIAVIGTGVMGSDHARNVARRVSRADLVAVADTDAARSTALAEQLDVPSPTVTAVIEDPEVDAVIIATHDSSHVELVLRCLDQGKAVLCEKPLSLDVEGCRRIVDHARADLVSVGFSRRFDPPLIDLKDAFNAGHVGRALLAHAVHRNVQATTDGDSASTIFNSGIHELDQTAWVLGSRIVEVSWSAPRSTALLPDRQDPQLLLLRTADGALTTVELFVNATFGYHVGLELVGERGVLQMQSPRGVQISRDLTARTSYPPDWRLRYAAAYLAEVQAWVDQLGGEKAPNLATAADGLAATLTARAAVESMHDQGAWVAVEPDQHRVPRERPR